MIETLPAVIVGGMIAFFSTIAGEITRERRAAQREQAARIYEYESTRQAREDDFQRENLLALQDAIFALMEAVGQFHGSDPEVSRQRGQWQHWTIDRGLYEAGTREARMRVSKHSQRVTDEEARAQADQLLTLVKTIRETGRHEEALVLMSQAGELTLALNERIGFLLREVTVGR